MNGKTIHVVQRTPPSARAASAAGLSSSATEPGQAPGERPRMDGSSFVVGSFSIPPDATDMNQVHVSMLTVHATLSAIALNKPMLKFNDDFYLRQGG